MNDEFQSGGGVAGAAGDATPATAAQAESKMHPMALLIHKVEAEFEREHQRTQEARVWRLLRRRQQIRDELQYHEFATRKLCAEQAELNAALEAARKGDERPLVELDAQLSKADRAMGEAVNAEERPRSSSGPSRSIGLLIQPQAL